MLVEINDLENGFILKAIWNMSILFDFDNTTEKEFKKTYGITKKGLKILGVELSDKLRGLKWADLKKYMMTL